jgi:molecular chaperone DnaK
MLSNTQVRRSIPEGSELDITIRIDVSRLIAVEAFVPHLNHHFGERLYVAKREEQDFAKLSSGAASEAVAFRQRLGEVEETVSAVPDESLQREVEDLRRTINELASKAPEKHHPSPAQDPDDARRLVEQSKTIRGRLSRLEGRASEPGALFKSSRFASEIEIAEEVVEKFGTNLEQQQLRLLRRELEKAVEKNNDKAMERIYSEIIGLRWRVLGKQDWFWRELFDSLRQPDTPFVDKGAAEKLFARGDAAIRSGDGESLRETVRELWKLQPKSEAEIMRDRALRSGLRKF